MPRVLDVYLFDSLVGRLIQSDIGRMKFRYDEQWLKKEDTPVLSHSLPKQVESFRARECLGFFGGILPEESKRERIAKNLGISKENAFAMLAEIGGECAGAVSFLREGQKLSRSEPGYRALSEIELESILNDLPKRPLMAGEEGIRLSLAGAQDKITLRCIEGHCSEGNFSLPLNGAPSTHILKPALKHFEDTVINEAVCMKLAKAIGLPVAEVEILRLGKTEVLSVTRFDRHMISEGSVSRLHQEDFCQALGIVSEMKYQSEGGVSLKQAFNLLREVSSIPALDLQSLLDASIFNFFIGNNDAHGKNFSLLYEGETVRLSPFYDLLSTVYYPDLSNTMAMKIGGNYAPKDIQPRHFERLADDAGLSKPMVLKRVSLIADKILTALPEVASEIPEAFKMIDFIASYTENRRTYFK